MSGCDSRARIGVVLTFHHDEFESHEVELSWKDCELPSIFGLGLSPHQMLLTRMIAVRVHTLSHILELGPRDGTEESKHERRDHARVDSIKHQPGDDSIRSVGVYIASAIHSAGKISFLSLLASGIPCGTARANSRAKRQSACLRRPLSLEDST